MNLQFLKTAIQAALHAGVKITEIYTSDDFNITTKADKSPLTKADIAAHSVIKQHLSETGYPVLSEEGKDIPYDDRKNWAYFWLVDPLDGTKEFIKRNGEFTVNIAFVRNQTPIMGVVYAPNLRLLYFGDNNLGSYKYVIDDDQELNEDLLENIINGAERLPVVTGNEVFTVVGSRSHMSPETEDFIDRLKERHPKLEMVSKGSALKLCMIAEGIADIYPRFAPTMEWDTAAGHAVVNFSGGAVMLHDASIPLKYNKESLTNPWFIARK